MVLRDISIEHEYIGRKTERGTIFVLHPYRNQRGLGTGKYEIIRDIESDGGKMIKRSAHVTCAELAELYARGLLDAYGIRLRLKPASGKYPVASPGKMVPRRCIAKGSDFERAIARTDVTTPVSVGLKNQLSAIGIFF